MVALTDPVEGEDDEYNAWYSDTHLGEVLAIEAPKRLTQRTGLTRNAWSLLRRDLTVERNADASFRIVITRGDSR